MEMTVAHTVEEALEARGEYRAAGTDLQERLRSGVTHTDLVDISRLPGLEAFEEHEGGLRVGALVTVGAVGRDERVRRGYPGLAQPAQAIATPQIRNVATMGGVLCQRTRCWYYRHPEFACYRSGGNHCPARDGNHHFGVCFDRGPCVHPHPSSVGLALLTYDAHVEVAGRGRLTVAELFGDGSHASSTHTLAEDELLTHVLLPPPEGGERASYVRLMSRKWAEWPLVEVVVRLLMDGGAIRAARVGVGGVAPVPLRLSHVEEALAGQPAEAEVFDEAAALATRDASPLPQTRYKVPMVRRSVREALGRALANEHGGRLLP